MIFLLLSYQLTAFFGPVGFILANCTNMMLRIVYSYAYIRRQYQHVQLNPLDGIKPSKGFLICLIVSGIICKVSENRLLQHTIIGHIGIGGAAVAVVLAIWSYENRELIRSYFNKKTKSS